MNEQNNTANTKLKTLPRWGWAVLGVAVVVVGGGYLWWQREAGPKQEAASPAADAAPAGQELLDGQIRGMVTGVDAANGRIEVEARQDSKQARRQEARRVSSRTIRYSSFLPKAGITAISLCSGLPLSSR